MSGALVSLIPCTTLQYYEASIVTGWAASSSHKKEGQVTRDQQPTHTVRKSWKETWVFFIPLHRWWGQRDPAPERDLSINLVCSPVCCVTPSFILQGGQDPQTTFSCLLISILNHRQSSFVSESALKCGGFDFKVFWSYYCLPHPIRIPAKFT